MKREDWGRPRASWDSCFIDLHGRDPLRQERTLGLGEGKVEGGFAALRTEKGRESGSLGVLTTETQEAATKNVA